MNFAPRQPNALFTFLMIGLSFVSSPGCSGRPKNVARKVTGKVTLGGQPLPNALVMFMPVEGGAPAMGKTDEAGSYNLVWAQSKGRKIEGAQIGENFVKISTYVEGAPKAQPPRTEVPEKVPFKYRVTDPPKVTVTPGTNTIDIPLEEGPVEPPPPPKGKKGKK